MTELPASGLEILIRLSSFASSFSYFLLQTRANAVLLSDPFSANPPLGATALINGGCYGTEDLWTVVGTPRFRSSDFNRFSHSSRCGRIQFPHKNLMISLPPEHVYRDSSLSYSTLIISLDLETIGLVDAIVLVRHNDLTKTGAEMQGTGFNLGQ